MPRFNYLVFIAFFFSLSACMSSEIRDIDSDWNARIDKAIEIKFSDLARSTEIVDSLLSLKKEVVSEPTLARAFHMRGVFLCMNGDLKSGGQDFIKAKDLYEAHSMITELGDVMFNLANVAISENKLDLAVARYEEVIEYCGNDCDPELVSNAKSHKCWALYKLGEYEQVDVSARALLEESTIGSDAYFAYTLLGNLSGRKEDSIATRNYYTKALEVASNDAGIEDLSYVNSAGALASYMNSSAEKSELLAYADSIYRSIPINYVHLECAISLWRAYCTTSSVEKQKEYYDIAHELIEKHDDGYNLSLMSLNEAQNMEGTGNVQNQIRLLDQAFENATNAGAYGVSKDVLDMLQELYITQNDNEGVTRCKALLIAMESQRKADAKGL